MRKPVEHVSSLFFTHEAAFLIGFPTAETVQLIVDSKEEFYLQKVKPTINTFKLFPKGGIKPNAKLSMNISQNLAMIAEQFQYEDDHEHFGSNSKKKNTTSRTNASQGQGSVIHRSPLFRLYSPANLVLKEEYSILSPESFKKINTREEQQTMKEKLKEWIQIGYHIHVAQAFKVDNIHGKWMIFLQKLKGKTLRDWMCDGFFEDKNKYMNSKRILNCLLQIAVGLNYIHKRNVIHQQLVPDHIYIENQKILKIGNLYNFNAVTGKMAKNSFSGGVPEYWSPQQGQIYDSAYDRGKKEGGYQSAMKLLPAISTKSDLYQLGLIIIELILGRRFWVRGDKAYLKQILQNQELSNCTKETTAFLFEQADDFLRPKPEERNSLSDFISSLLIFYAKHFRNAEDLLWVRFFDEEKYESDLLNNKAVGLYLSGNEQECERNWARSLTSNPFNLTAQYNFSHFKRMKRIVDDTKLNKNLLLLPESRKRNFYLLISNLVMLPLLKEPFKTYNFNPKLSRHKQIETLSNIIEALQKYKKPKDYVFQLRYHLTHYKFEEGHVAGNYYLGRVKNTNKFQCYRIDKEIKSHSFKEIVCTKQAQSPDARQAFSCVDLTNKYLAISQNSYLAIYNIENMDNITLFHEILDYGSSITTMQFDQKSQVLGIGSNQFTIKLINLTTKQIYKVINIGQKFIIKNLQYYDRNTCISYSYEKAISFHRIQTTKNLFTIRCNGTVLGYKILQVTLTSHIMIVHTSQKFEIWNLKDKILIRNIEIDEAPKIQGFYANSSKKMVAHFTKNAIRIWNYSNGLILKTFRTPVSLVWIHISPDAKYLRSLDVDGNFTTRYIDFQQFLKNFDGVCVPNQICMTEQRQEYGQDVSLYVKHGRQLVQNLNDYRLNEQEKKVSLQKMYKLGQTIKNALFFQDKDDLKTIFIYLNGIRQGQDRSSRINAHSEQYIFTSPRQQFVTATSNYNEGHWLIGQTDGSIRMASPPNNIVFTIRPKQTPVTYLYLQPTSIFISYSNTCLLVERQTLNIVVTHTSYHKKPIRMGLVINSILVTGDQDELILFWNKEKVRRYNIPVNMGDIVGKQLVIAGFDNRIRLYDIHHENGVQKAHVFVGHTMNVYNMIVLDDGIFTTSSYDGTIRWWNTQMKTCFSYFNFKKFFPSDKILYIDMPKFSLEEQKFGKFDRQGCALILLNNSEIVVFDTMRKQVKWKLQLTDDVVKVFWTNYPNTFAAVTYEQIRIINIYWRYMVLKK